MTDTLRDLIRRLLAEGTPAGGYYHQNFFAVHDARQIVVRKPIQDARQMDFRQFSEVDVLKKLSLYGLRVPSLLRSLRFESSDILVLDHIDGDTLPPMKTLPSASAAAVVNGIREFLCDIHSLPLENFRSIAKLDLPESATGFAMGLMQFYRSLVDKYWGTYSELFSKLGFPKTVEEVFENISLELIDQGLVFVHGDIHEGNIIQSPESKELSFIDWELALIAPRAYELASHLHKSDFLPAQEEELVSGYAESNGISHASIWRDIVTLRRMEQVKSVCTDVVRYIGDLQANEQETLKMNARKYHRKLIKAYAVWCTPSQRQADEEAVQYYFHEAYEDSHPMKNCDK